MKETFFYPGDRVVFAIKPYLEAIVVAVSGNGDDRIQIRWFDDESYCSEWVRPFEIIHKRKDKKRSPKYPAPMDGGAHAFN